MILQLRSESNKKILMEYKRENKRGKMMMMTLSFFLQ